MDLSKITVIDVLLLKQINKLSAIRKNPNLTNHLQTLIKKLEDAATPKLQPQAIKEFRSKAKEKFELGAKEHANERWEDVDHLKELKGELLDSYNYILGKNSGLDPLQSQIAINALLSIYQMIRRK